VSVLAAPRSSTLRVTQDRRWRRVAKLRVLRDELWTRAKLPRTLDESGRVQRAQLPTVARMALDDGALVMNPVDVQFDDALAVLERAY
jgi:alcohol dehydrogenase